MEFNPETFAELITIVSGPRGGGPCHPWHREYAVAPSWSDSCGGQGAGGGKSTSCKL